MKSKRIIVSVISDLVSDQRVHKVCTYLHDKGYSVTLIGRRFSNAQSIEKRKYKTQRLWCFFKKGVAQYAEFNLKLFIALWFKKADLFVANDLDTLVPNFIHANLRRKKLVYDSHEYFTGTPELQYKPAKRRLWKEIEKRLLPHVKYAYTVNASIAALYKKECSVDMKVVQNVPLCNRVPAAITPDAFPRDRFILLLQGAGINHDRGAEELVACMRLLPDHFLLVLIGGGDVWDHLKTSSTALGLTNKIRFIEKVPFPMLPAYTKQAHLGISLDKPTCLNHQFMLPNKIFDYMQAGVPLLASDIVEVKKIIDTHHIGMYINEITPQTIADAVLWIYNHKEVYAQWKNNTTIAARAFCWENEQRVLDEIYTD